ncbi:MAG: BatD family protein [Opitutaceae bacterium]|nr:BatD family protein [Cytophagales bacterium]
MFRFYCFVFVLLGIFPVFSQEASITIGNNNVPINQAFTITITVTNEQLREYTNFPDIPGFRKQGTSSMSSTNIVNGSITSTSSIVQNYAAEKEGKFVLKGFKMKINGKEISSPGTTITIGPPAQTNRRGFFDDDSDPFEEFFGEKRNNSPKEFVDVQDDAFFIIQSDKKSVYRGEGFLLMAALYIGENNRAQLQFPNDLSQQLSAIIKKVKPASCWEENFEIHEIVPEVVTIEGKRYRRFKLFQAMMYPLNTQQIRINSAGLKMIKYKEAKNPTFFGNNLKEDYKVFESKPFEIKVKELPPHPLRETIPVGEFTFEEDIRGTQLEAGKSFSHNFMVSGEGNFSSLEAPQIPENDKLEFYSPEVRQSINRGDNKVKGTKLFTYAVIPKEPGEYDLGKYIQIPYFNPAKGKYDTLRSTLKIKVKGESQKDVAIQANEYDSFYSAIDKESNRFYNDYYNSTVKLVANILLLFMLVATGFIVLRPLKNKIKK